MKVLLKSLPIVAALALIVQRAGAAEPLDLFESENAARQNCGNDVIVWLDVPSNRYLFKGQDGYGRTKDGSYACKRDADRAGNRAAPKGHVP